MIELIALGVVLGLSVTGVARGVARAASAHEADARAAVAQVAFAGLQRAIGVRTEIAPDGGLRAQVDGMSLQVRLVGVRAGRVHFRCALGPLPGDVRVCAESLAVQIGGRRPDGLGTGDPQFDRAVSVEGPEPETTARLDAPTRAALRALVSQGGVLEDGHWMVDVHGPRGDGDDDAGLERTARLLLVAGRPWGASKPPLQALTEIALHDPLPAVRARALLRLFRKPWSAVAPFPEVAQRVVGGDLIEALASSSPDVVVAAALLLRLDGTAAAVPALRAAAARMGASPERDAVEQAVLAIQARVGAVQGALSVASQDGALSVSEDGGQVSVASPAGLPTAAPPPRPRG